MTEEGKLLLDRIEEMNNRLNKRLENLDIRLDKLYLAVPLDQALNRNTGKDMYGIRLNILENKVEKLEETVLKAP